MFEKFKKYLKNNYNKINILSLLSYFSIIIFFLYQHTKGLFWDFAAYKLNALYFLGKSDYFEFLRPPLVPILMAITHKIISIPNFDELLYIIASTIFFIISCNSFIKNTYLFIFQKDYNKLKNKDFFNIKFWQFVFVTSFITPYFLLNSFIAGSELLSLALLIFFISQILKENNIAKKNTLIHTYAGIIFGLLFLTRYSNLLFGVFLIFAPRIKIIIKRIFHFLIIIAPWFTYNFVKTGNFLTSMANGYAQNILFRQGLNRIIPLEQYLIFLNLIAVFFVIGLIYYFYQIYKTKNKNMLYLSLIILFITFITIRDFINIPLRSLRYLFNINLIIAFFSSFFLFNLFTVKKTKKNPLIKILTILAIILSITSNLYHTINIEKENQMHYNKNRYLEAKETLIKLNLTQCSIRSPDWVLLNYLGIRSKNSYDQSSINKHMEQSEIVILFKPLNYMQQYVNNLPIIKNNSNFIILGEIPIEKYDCKSPYALDETYLNYYSRFYYIEKNITVNTEVCHVLFKKHKFLEDFCKLFTNY